MARILIVGAGAVGQCYGWHLQRGGAEIGLLVKEKYVRAARAGFTVHPLNLPEKCPTRFEGFDVQTAPGGTWNQVWLCVSSTALKSTSIDAVLAASGDATIVHMAPGIEDFAWLAQRVASERIVSALIHAIAWQGPLPGEDRAPGVAFWFPPLSALLLTGVAERVQEVLVAARSGGLKARWVADVEGRKAKAEAVLLPSMAGLEAAGWSLRGFARSPELQLASAAAREALGVVAAVRDEARWPLGRLIRPWTLRAAFLLARRLAPFPLEPYLKYHFTKVGDQTRQALRLWRDHAVEHGLPHAALDELAGRL